MKGSNYPTSLFPLLFLLFPRKTTIVISLLRISIRWGFNVSFACPGEGSVRASMRIFRVVGDLLQAKASRRLIPTWMGNPGVSVEAECAPAILIAY